MEEHPQQTMTLTVEGMHCDGCAARLRARLETAPGVREVAVSFAERQARVVYDAHATEERRLVDEIEKSGFRVAGRPNDTHAHSATGEISSTIGTDVSKRGWKPTLLSIPAILASLIPSITCPLCVTAYTALLSTLGLGFLMSSTYLLPLTVAMLAVAVAALGFEALKRGNWGPFALSLFGSAVILIGKFFFVSEPATYAGVALLLAASVWNLGPRLLRFRSRRAEPNPVA
jgi:copper chaperone CopZ